MLTSCLHSNKKDLYNVNNLLTTMETSNSTLIRISNPMKKLLEEVREQNPKFKSYSELLEWLLQAKSTSKATRLVNDFLSTKQRCSNLATQVYLSGCRADIIGGRLLVGRKELTQFNHLIETELHMVEIKKTKEEIREAISQLLLYKQILQKTSWVDFLYMYLAVESEEGENKISKGMTELLRKQGIGLLTIKGATISLEFEPMEQTTFLLSTVRNKGKFECRSCSSDYHVKEMECQRCGSLLNFNIYGNSFKKTSVRLTNEIKRVLVTDPTLKYIFKNVDNVLDNLYKKIGAKERVDRSNVYGGEKKVLV